MFTYATSISTDLHRVRFRIGDTVEGEGPLPGGRNFTDEEITAVIAIEGRWERAAAACLEKMSTEWRLYPSVESDQFSLSRSHISRGYAEEAQKLRDIFGWSSRSSSGFAGGSVIRVDEYSDDLTVSGE